MSDLQTGSQSQNQDIFSNERQQEILQQIQDLQNSEKMLYTSLENITADPKITDQLRLPLQTELIRKMNEISKLRINLFEYMNAHYQSIQQSVNQTRDDLVDKFALVKVVEEELNHAKQHLNSIQETKQNQLRMVEIHTYYSQKYQAYIEVMKHLIMFILIPVFVILYVQKQSYFPLPSMVNSGLNGLLAIILLYTIYYVSRKVIDFYSRDSQRFEEYDWTWNPEANKPSVYDYDADQLNLLHKKVSGDDNDEKPEKDYAFEKALGNLGCMNDDCCGKGLTFDTTLQKCIIKQKKPNPQTNLNFNIEGFSTIPEVDMYAMV
jgi:hypothetical protein